MGIPPCRRLLQSSRLVHPTQFEAVFADATRLAGGGYVVLARANDQTFPRLGLAISKRAARRAVDRNKLKRLARESFRNHSAILPAVDIVVLCSPNAASLSNRKLLSALERAWEGIRSTTWVNS